MRVGTKELKNRLSHYVRAARAGEIVEITDRGTVVAEMRAVRARRGGAADEARAVEHLAADGVLSCGTGGGEDFVPLRARRRVRLSDWVVEDRR